jgi:hypothetical protein
MNAKNFEANASGVIKALLRSLFYGTDETHEKSVMIPGVPAEMRNQHLPIRSPDRHRYPITLGPLGPCFTDQLVHVHDKSLQSKLPWIGREGPPLQ